MRKFLNLLFKICRNIIYIIFVIFVISFLIILISQNIQDKPIKIKSVDSVDKIEIVLTIMEEKFVSYELEITEKDEIRKLNNELCNIKAKKIINGGGIDTDTIIYISVYHNENYEGDKLEYFTIYGEHILLNEGKKAYKMKENDSNNLSEYILRLCKSTP